MSHDRGPMPPGPRPGRWPGHDWGIRAEAFHTLTPREREILALLARGFTNREIAGRLFISLHTVKNHVSNIYKKLGSADRTRVALTAVREGWISPAEGAEEAGGNLSKGEA